MKKGPKYPHEEKYVQNGKVLSPQVFGPIVINTFLHVLCNEKYSREDQAVVYELCHHGHQSVRNGDDYGKILGNIPWLRHIAPNMSGYNALRESFTAFRFFIEKTFQKYDDTYDPENIRNFLDVLNKEMRRNENGHFERELFLEVKWKFYMLPL